MSAFLVNSDTLDLLASAATLYDTQHTLYVYLDDNIAGPTQGLTLITGTYGERYVEIRGGDENHVVRELWHANIVSLQARYDEEQVSHLMHDDLASNVFRPILDASMSEILGALGCYEYQSCEANTWRYSFAKAYCDALRKKLCGIISRDHWEYERPANYVETVSLMSMISTRSEL
jgi:hypothetical protein